MGKHLRNDPEAMSVLQRLFDEGINDSQIVDRLRDILGRTWSQETIRRLRLTHSVVSTNVATEQKDDVSQLDVSFLASPPPQLSRAQKEQWFRERFRTSHFAQLLEQQFEPEEVQTYMQEFGQVCTQFEDIVASEFMQIDDFLKHRLLLNRQLRAMRSLEQDIVALRAWIAKNPVAVFDPNLDKEEKKAHIERLRSLEAKQSALVHVHDRYDKLVAARQRIQENLAATRKDRVSEIKGGGTSFFDLVSELTTSEAARERHGRYAELTRLAAEDIHHEFRKTIEFPDGEQDAIILDDETPIPEE